MRIFMLFLLTLILTASWQQAQAEEVCLDGDTVIGIKDMVVVTDQFGTINIDVDFRYTTGFDIYGSGLDDFPFDPPEGEEDAFVTMLAINNALNAHNPVPDNAGQPGQTAYFIGVEEETEEGERFVLAFGSEKVTGNFWESCTSASDCLFGIAKLEADQRFVYADLARANGSSCDNAPGPSFTITPGITGSWFLDARDGEGYNIEIVGSALDPQLLAYFYTYDDAGNQMWLVGQGEANGDTAVVPVQVTSGPVYGDDYDRDDVLREDWGTLTFKFSSCTAGSVVRESTMGFGTTTVDIVRLTSVTGLTCP
jgi:hypothetical protein